MVKDLISVRAWNHSNLTYFKCDIACLESSPAPVQSGREPVTLTVLNLCAPKIIT